jgi:hypothetical protein
MTHLSRSFRMSLLKPVLLLAAGLTLVGSSSAQTARNRAGGPAEEAPILHEYRGIQIGSVTDEVRKKLGTPADKGDEQDFFVFSEKETAQVLYDKEHKVITISVDFSNGASGVLTPQQVFGTDIEAKPDGSKYKLVRYPKAGYWLSYNRTTGNAPLVSVTLQKIQ